MGKTPKKEKTEEPVEEDKEEDSRPYEELIKRVAPIAKPLAPKKLTKKLYKAVKKAAKSKQLFRGVKEVTKALRKKEKGICVFAGDISPIDVITHMPILCEEGKIQYIYVPSKEDLGAAGQTKRPTSVVLIKPSAEGYTELEQEVKEIPAPF